MDRAAVIRTCIGCRERAVKSDLIRIVAIDGVVTWDHAARMPGRGAYLHPEQACIDKAIARKAIGRALRSDRPLNTDGLTLTNGPQPADPDRPGAPRMSNR